MIPKEDALETYRIFQSLDAITSSVPPMVTPRPPAPVMFTMPRTVALPPTIVSRPPGRLVTSAPEVGADVARSSIIFTHLVIGERPGRGARTSASTSGADAGGAIPTKPKRWLPKFDVLPNVFPDVESNEDRWKRTVAAQGDYRPPSSLLDPVIGWRAQWKKEP